MNLLKPKTILVASGDPHPSWIVLAHATRKSQKRLRFKMLALSLGAFVAVVLLVPTLWNVAAKTVIPESALSPLPEIIPATVGGAFLPYADPSIPKTAPTSTAASAAAAKRTTSLRARILIPKIGVNMPIVEGKNESALLNGAWLSPWGSTPDQGGNTTIFGHRFLRLYPNPETFHALDRLAVGDTFTVEWNDTVYTYRVIDVRVVPPTEVSVMGPTTKPSVTLITCTPVFTTKDRLVVRGERI